MFTSGIVVSPLEQFDIVALIYYPTSYIDFSIINASFLSFVSACIFIIIVQTLIMKISIYPKKNLWQLMSEQIYITLQGILINNCGIKNQHYYPIIFSIMCILSIFNLFGLLPYSYTLSSHILITFSLAFSMFFSINYMGIKKHKRNFLNLFLPSGTPLPIIPFLVLIEILSYVSRVFSLAIRLFANMMAGHTLLKILTSFVFATLATGSIFFILNLIPILILHIVIVMECCIAGLQIYVFIVLSSIYIQDVTDVDAH